MLKVLEIESQAVGAVPYVGVGPGGRQLLWDSLPVQRVWVSGLPAGLEAIVLTADLQAYSAGADRQPQEARRLLGYSVAEGLAAMAATGVLPPAERTGVVLGGDLFADPTLQTRGGLGDVEGVWRHFAERFRWVVGVAGNHDSFAGVCEFGMTFRGAPNIYAMDGHSVMLDGLRIGGVSGVLGKVSKPWRKDWRAYRRLLETVLQGGPDLLVLHQGPDDPRVPSRRGEPLIREVLAAAPSPTLVVNGHKHWNDSALAKLPPVVTVLNVDMRCLVLQMRPPRESLASL